MRLKFNYIPTPILKKVQVELGSCMRQRPSYDKFSPNFMRLSFRTWIVHGPEAFIGKASKGEIVGVLLRILGNAAYESLRLALRVKFDEK